MIIFGSYLDGDMSVADVTTIIVATDTAVALIAGLAMFPIAFGTLPGENLVGLFFLLLFAAAITSSVFCTAGDHEHFCSGLFEIAAAKSRYDNRRRAGLALSPL